MSWGGEGTQARRGGHWHGVNVTAKGVSGCRGQDWRGSGLLVFPAKPGRAERGQVLNSSEQPLELPGPRTRLHSLGSAQLLCCVPGVGQKSGGGSLRSWGFAEWRVVPAGGPGWRLQSRSPGPRELAASGRLREGDGEGEVDWGREAGRSQGPGRAVPEVSKSHGDSWPEASRGLGQSVSVWPYPVLPGVEFGQKPCFLGRCFDLRRHVGVSYLALAARLSAGRPAPARVQHGGAAPALRVQPRLLLLEDLPEPRRAKRPQVRCRGLAAGSPW